MKTTRTRLWIGIGAAVLGWGAADLQHAPQGGFSMTRTASAASEAGERGEAGEKSERHQAGERGEAGEKSEGHQAGERGEAGEKSEGHQAGGQSTQATGDKAGEAGEAGESGKAGGSAQTANGRDADIAYLTALGLIEGHLRVGVTLYEDARADAAKTHMKHPEDELYADLEREFQARDVPGFDTELATLARLVESGAGAAEVEAAFDRVLQGLERARSGAANHAEPAVTLRVARALVATAAEEYSAAVENGQVHDPHEYQDAYGFVEVARRLIGTLDTGSDAAVAQAVERARKALAGLDGAWPRLDGGAAVDPSLLHGAAARIEIAAGSL